MKVNSFLYASLLLACWRPRAFKQCLKNPANSEKFERLLKNVCYTVTQSV